MTILVGKQNYLPMQSVFAHFTFSSRLTQLDYVHCKGWSEEKWAPKLLPKLS